MYTTRLRSFKVTFIIPIEPYCNNTANATEMKTQGDSNLKDAIASFQTEHLTFILGKPMPTKKLAIQLTRTAIDMAAGLGPCENSSAVIIHGMEPGPTAKNTTKLSVDTTDR